MMCGDLLTFKFTSQLSGFFETSRVLTLQIDHSTAYATVSDPTTGIDRGAADFQHSG